MESPHWGCGWTGGMHGLVVCMDCGGGFSRIMSEVLIWLTVAVLFMVFILLLLLCYVGLNRHDPGKHH